MRWAFMWLLVGCSDELSFGRLRASDAAACGSILVADEARCPGSEQALCSCGDYVSSGPTRVEGALAIGGLLSAGDLIAEQLTLGGTQGAALTGDLQVTGRLQSLGPVQGRHNVRVDADARIAGDVRLDGLRVGGTLTLSPSAAYEIASAPPTPVRAPVEVRSPCDCTPKLDLGAQIDAARKQNDNASIALEPARGLRTFDTPRSLDLPCGRYYVDELYAASPITLRVHDSVALYIDQRIVTESSASLTITLDPSAELHLFIRRGITAAGPLTVTGGQAHLYVGGQDSFFFAAPTRIEATIYAPASELVTQQPFELTGTALVKRVVAEQLLT
ncbi:MAG TPA: polymer-forming cytoskeletal protein, partial [Polyangiales bacterium]|nr:polymer-forming cytoskeletal protein [Polyangiales bacterium]